MSDLVLDPKTTALVLIDLEYGIAAMDLAPYSSADVVSRCAGLAKTFRKKGAAVIFVKVLIPEMLQLPVDTSLMRGTPPPNATEFVPEAGVQAEDLIVKKRSWGAFYGTDLELHLRRRGIKTIVIGGIATNFGVESTARAAFDQGYEVVFAEDAMSSVSAEAHEFPIKNVFPMMGRVRSVTQIVKALG
ncbi:hydrolase [Tunturiibacter gelidoferens]|uniref:Nicotinamidase-related amidase n=1 Tax=Tunturiibacter lichenicola TaxID=2051959 RepID=A0A7Y9T6F4_9BACT|nr:nicotinamidase-related amidase [Edaphobacter lichenicola]